MRPVWQIIFVLLVIALLFIIGNFVHSIVEILHNGFATGSEMLYGRDPF